MLKKVFFAILALVIALLGILTGILIEQSTEIPEPQFGNNLTMFVIAGTPGYDNPHVDNQPQVRFNNDFEIVIIARPVWSSQDHTWFYKIRLFNTITWVEEKFLRLGKGA